MRIALGVGRRGLGNVAPNPAVGAVIADEETGEILARGWTQPGGRPHAETEALARAGSRARGQTLYVTLEPCAHFGKTPPCADAIVAAGLSRVVIGVSDPDPRTAGRGVQRLRDAGIAVETDVRAEEARWLTLGHILRVTERRPFVQVKLALSAAGEAPRGASGQPQWVTGPVARARGHLLRAEADAILVGAQTVRDDDPELTCRLPGLGDCSPIRVVLSTDLNIPLKCQIVQSARKLHTWLVGAANADAVRREAFKRAGILVYEADLMGGGLDLMQVLNLLADAGVTRLMVEGGAGIWQGFAEAGLVDEAVMFMQGADADLEAGLIRYLPGLSLSLAETARLGGDTMYVLRRV